MYEYFTPFGYGDTFFQYVIDAQTLGLVNGQDYLQNVRVNVTSGGFVMRQWAGLSTIGDRLNIYDEAGRRFASDAMFIGSGANNPTDANMVVVPEREYITNSKIAVDLISANQTVAGTDGGLTIYASQLVFSGVRRRANQVGDPVASGYKYYEKPYSMSYQLTINNYASTGGVFNSPILAQIPIDNYDFELRRIELALPVDQSQPAPFKMTLYDSNKVARSNLPVLATYLCHLDPETSNGQMSFWPCPPMLYPVRSSIFFDVFSLLVSPTSLPATFDMLFHGVRRIPCA